jgi:hypothetical protein
MSLRSPKENKNPITLDAHICHAEHQRSICFSHGEEADFSALPQNDILRQGKGSL